MSECKTCTNTCLNSSFWSVAVSAPFTTSANGFQRVKASILVVRSWLKALYAVYLAKFAAALQSFVASPGWPKNVQCWHPQTCHLHLESSRMVLTRNRFHATELQSKRNFTALVLSQALGGSIAVRFLARWLLLHKLSHCFDLDILGDLSRLNISSLLRKFVPTRPLLLCLMLSCALFVFTQALVREEVSVRRK